MIASQKLKILHMIDSGGQGGAEQVLYSLLENLGDERYEHHLFLPGEGWLNTKLSQTPGVTIVFCNGGGRFNFGYIRTIAAYLRENHIQLIHSHLMGTSLYASIVGFFCRVPVICTFHGYIDCRHGDRLQRLKLNLIGLCAKRIVTVSDGLKDFFVSRTSIGRHKYVTIYNGIDTEKKCAITRAEARRIFGLSDTDIVIGAIGNVKPAKGYDVLIKAAKILAGKNENYRFIIAGNTANDQYDDLLKLRDKLQLQDKLFFLGFVENTDAFLRALDVFVLSSVSEGFSLATIEAMYAGIAVVATRSGGPQEIVTYGLNGVLVGVGDVNELVSSIVQIIDDPVFMNKLAENAKNEVAARFSIEAAVKKYESEYFDLLNLKTTN